MADWDVHTRNRRAVVSISRNGSTRWPREPIPDESATLHFGYRLKRHRLSEAMLKPINAFLEGPGLQLRAGTILDANSPGAAGELAKVRTRAPTPPNQSPSYARL